MKRNLLYILVVLLGFMNVDTVVASTSKVVKSTLINNFDDNQKLTTWAAEHVTFTFSGNNLATQNWGETYFYLQSSSKSARTFLLTWSVASGYDINVTQLELNIDRASSLLCSSYLTIGGKKTGDLRLKGGSFYSNSLSCGNDGNVSVVFETGEPILSQISVKYITVTYTITPRITAQDGSVPVTICEEHKQTIALPSIAHPDDQSGHLSTTYTVTSSNKDYAHIDGTDFYATKVGTYTLQASVAGATCHEANSKTFTITVNKAQPVLSAPTASDIDYPATLASSVLTGGSATIEGCGEVAGTWAWQDATIQPAVGDGQSFTAVFTPIDNENIEGGTVAVTVNVKRHQCIFDGSGDDAARVQKWSKADNWLDDVLPTRDDDVLVIANLLLDEEVSAYSVTIANGAVVTIAPNGGLTVGAGGIEGATTSNLILKAGTEGATKGETGYLRVSPSASMPEATVELYSIGYYDRANAEEGNIAAWQYVGFPVASSEKAGTVYKTSWIYDWDESAGDWVNNRKNLTMSEPFVGHITTQYRSNGGVLLTYAGQLVDNKSVELPLAYTGNGMNLLANSYAAPIDITKFDESDFSDGVEATIYLFNTGSAVDAETSTGVNAKGQYTAIPVKTAKAYAATYGIDPVIASMQGFCVNTTKSGTLKLDYNKLVWKDGEATTNSALRAPKRAKDDEISGTMSVSLTDGNWNDNLFVLQSDDYDALYANGEDARKMMNGSLNIFAVENGEQLSLDATDAMEGMFIGVRTGDTTQYTMTFGHLRSEQPLSLYDAVTNQTTDIEEGTTYTFVAEPDTTIVDRFEVIARHYAPSVATALDNAVNENNMKLYGTTIFICNSGENSWQVFDAEGRLIDSQSFVGNTTIDTSRFGHGVYIVRCGKNVCKLVR